MLVLQEIQGGRDKNSSCKNKEDRNQTSHTEKEPLDVKGALFSSFDRLLCQLLGHHHQQIVDHKHWAIMGVEHDPKAHAVLRQIQ